jgi:hypothetical protein
VQENFNLYQLGQIPPPKRGRKWGQSNTEATTTKRAKPTTKNDVEGSGEEEPEAGKSTKKGKSGGKKGKKARCVASFTPVLAY